MSELDDVVPETKDWTWVLEAKCDDCGFDAPGLELATVPGRLEGNADTWVEVLARPDVFRLYDYRLHLMLGQDDPYYPNWDQDETAVTDRYREQDPAAVSAELVEAQRRLSASFAGVDGAQWQRTGNRSDNKRFTVESFARYMLHDPVHHVWDVTHMRAD